LPDAKAVLQQPDSRPEQTAALLTRRGEREEMGALDEGTSGHNLMFLRIACVLLLVRAAVEEDHLVAGITAAENGDLEAAIVYFRVATQSADSTEAWFNLGAALAEQAEHDARGKNMLTEAKVCLETALARDPRNADAKEEMTRLGMDTGYCADNDELLQRNTMKDFMRCVDAAMFGACKDVLVPGAESDEDTFHARSECPESCGLCDADKTAMPQPKKKKKNKNKNKNKKRREKANGKERQVAGFYHMGSFGQYKRIAKEQIAAIVDGGLYELAEKIDIGLVGEDQSWEPPAVLNKISVGVRVKDPKVFEVPTLTRLHNYCKANPSAYVFYIHSKGASSMEITDGRVAIPGAVEDWRKFMEYFVIEQHADCVDALGGGSSTCGANYMPGPPHYSGNFWWAKCSCVSKLPPVPAKERLASEQWLLQQGGACLSEGKGPRNMWYSGLYWNIQGHGHYVTKYPRERYEGLKCMHEACTNPPIPGINW
jgi:hypothetical protein